MTFKKWLALTWIVAVLTIIGVSGTTFLIYAMIEDVNFRYLIYCVCGCFGLSGMTMWSCMTLDEK